MKINLRKPHDGHSTYSYAMDYLTFNSQCLDNLGTLIRSQLVVKISHHRLREQFYIIYESLVSTIHNR